MVTFLTHTPAGVAEGEVDRISVRSIPYCLGNVHDPRDGRGHNWICTLSTGHGGPHIAHISVMGFVCAIWLTYHPSQAVSEGL